MRAGDIVRSCAGKDKGKAFLVLAVQDGYVELANGRRRKVQRPKRKSIKHVQLLSESSLPQPISNQRIKKLLQTFYTHDHKEEA